MKRKQDSFVRIAITVLFIAMAIVGMAVLYKATNTGSTELRSKAAEYKDVLVKEWEFKKGTEGWSGVGTIKVDQVDDALRGKLLEIYGKDGQIVNSAVNEKMAQGLKYIKFKLALRRPEVARATPAKSSCIQVIITCPNGKQQPAFTKDCKRIPCPDFTPRSEADCNRFSGTSEYCNNQQNCQYGSGDLICHYRPQRQGGGAGENPSGGFAATQPCPQDVKKCPDGTTLTRMQTGNGCEFPACPERRATPTPEVFNLVVQYMIDNQWVSQTVKVTPNESYMEFSVQLPLKALTVQRIRFVVPVAAFQYAFWFDWIKLWSKVAIPPTPTNTPTPKPTATPTPTPPCLPLPSCVYVGTVDNRGSIVYCSPPPPPSGRVYCPKPTATPTPTARPLGKCIVSGCNGELCVDENSSAKNSICVYRDEYQCYKTATCARQINGGCGWTQTTELSACLNKYSYGGSSAPQSEADCNKYSSSPVACENNVNCRYGPDNACHYVMQRYNTDLNQPQPQQQ